jgi:hypothetical protein
MNYYLKTTDEDALWAALSDAGLAVKDYDPEDALNVRPDDLDPETEWSPSGEFTWRFTGEDLDMIGSIYTSTGNMLTDEDGLEYPEMVAIDGFHANLKSVKPIEGLPTVPKPNTPYRKWAGE